MSKLSFLLFVGLWLAGSAAAWLAQHWSDAALVAGGVTVLVISLRVNRP